MLVFAGIFIVVQFEPLEAKTIEAEAPVAAVQPESNGEVDYKKLERPTAIRKFECATTSPMSIHQGSRFRKSPISVWRRRSKVTVA